MEECWRQRHMMKLFNIEAINWNGQCCSYGAIHDDAGGGVAFVFRVSNLLFRNN